MGIFLTGSYDITQSLIALRQVTRAAQEIVEVATALSVQPDMSASLTAGQVYQAQTAIYALMPRLRSGRDVNKFSVTLSSVVFASPSQGCIPGVDCRLTAYTAWSNALPQGIQTTRSCGVVAQVSATQLITISNLPTAGIMTLTSIIVADVSYIYQPLFVNFLTGPITLRHTAFMPPRIGKATQYKPAITSSDHSLCPGSL